MRNDVEVKPYLKEIILSKKRATEKFISEITFDNVRSIEQALRDVGARSFSRGWDERQLQMTGQVNVSDEELEIIATVIISDMNTPYNKNHAAFKLLKKTFIKGFRNAIDRGVLIGTQIKYVEEVVVVKKDEPVIKPVSITKRKWWKIW